MLARHLGRWNWQRVGVSQKIIINGEKKPLACLACVADQISWQVPQVFGGRAVWRLEANKMVAAINACTSRRKEKIGENKRVPHMALPWPFLAPSETQMTDFPPLSYTSTDKIPYHFPVRSPSFSTLSPECPGEFDHRLCSARKGYLFQASGIWKGRDFIGWRIWKGREICHLGLCIAR